MSGAPVLLGHWRGREGKERGRKKGGREREASGMRGGERKIGGRRESESGIG